MVKNILPATLAAFVQNFRIEDIVKALHTFIPSPEQTPGRMNIFSLKKFDLMLDYAHNPDGFLSLKKFIDQTNATRKIGIITAVGDRRDEDIKSLGYTAAQIFDELIIRHDKDLRGRTKEEITELLIEGIYSFDEQKPLRVISDEKEAIRYAMNNCPVGSFISVFTDSIQSATKFIKDEKQKEEAESDINELIFTENS